jgi:hypothetical protein
MNLTLNTASFADVELRPACKKLSYITKKVNTRFNFWKTLDKHKSTTVIPSDIQRSTVSIIKLAQPNSEEAI